MFQSTPEDFKLGNTVTAQADIVLSNPCWSLYCLDLDKREALFVKTPEHIDLTQAAFLFQEQFKHALEVLIIDFETFHEIAATIRPGSASVVFVHSVGRCGSTLVSQVFSALPGVCGLSEPDPATQLTEWRGRRFLTDEELRVLAESATRFNCKPWPARKPDTHWVFKYRAQCIEIADWLMLAFPKAKQLFIRRQPLSWLESVFRAFVDARDSRDPAYIALFEEVWARYFPLIRSQQIAGKPMSVAKTWMHVWIAAREAHARHRAAGLPFYEFDYESLKADPERILNGVFEYCEIAVDDWSAIRVCLQKDSQAGSVIARDKVKGLDRCVPEDGLAEARALLEQWGYKPEHPGARSRQALHGKR